MPCLASQILEKTVSRERLVGGVQQPQSADGQPCPVRTLSRFVTYLYDTYIRLTFSYSVLRSPTPYPYSYTQSSEPLGSAASDFAAFLLYYSLEHQPCGAWGKEL